MLSALMRKDLRVYRATVIGGAAVTVAPYAGLLIALLAEPLAYGKAEEVTAAANAGVALAAVVAATFGGMAFASERRERSAEFLAMLPVPRRRVAASKLLLSLACLGAMAAVHVAVLAIVARVLEAWGSLFAWDNFFREALVSLAVLVVVFGLAWLASSALDSAVIAACISIGGTIVLLVIAGTLLRDSSYQRYGGENTWLVQGGVALLAAALGIPAILIGTAVFSRRVAP